MLYLWLLTAQLAAQMCWACAGALDDVDLTKLQSFDYKPRIFIMSDILNEPDDSMSLVRYLLYSNEFDTRGICATTSWHLRNRTHPEEMRKIISAYGEVVDNLNRHVNPNASYQSAGELLSLVSSGPASYGRAALNETLSEGAQRIIEALEESVEPLFITGWGGVNTLAQALLNIDNTKSAAEAATLRSRIRLYSISDQDDTGAWIRARYPDIFYIVSFHDFNVYGEATWTGIGLRNCPCVNETIVSNPWLDVNIRVGPLGAVYPQIVYSMEGDTPSFLWLIQNGLSYRDRIDWGGWGGRYSRPVAPSDWVEGLYTNHFTNSRDQVVGADGKSYSTAQATIWRWRTGYQEDFAARMHWTLTPNFTDAGHPPVLNINGQPGPDPVFVKAKAKELVILDAGETYDPDHPTDNSQLEFQWAVYNEATAYGSGQVEINAVSSQPDPRSTPRVNDGGFANITRGSKVQVIVPESTSNDDSGLPTTNFHILLQVTNRAGPYPIRRYQRVIFQY